MKYSFTFKEVNFGSIEIESDRTPTESEVIDEIMKGNAYFKHTEYENIKYQGCERSCSRKDRALER